MDAADILAKFVVIVGGLLAAWKATNEIRLSRKQRDQDLRWKQASMARDLVKEIHEDKHAMAAVEMLDWGPGRHEYQPGSDTEIKVGQNDIDAALRKERGAATAKKDEFIWESFDWLFYYLDRLEHYVRTGLIDFEDVHDVFVHYAGLIEARREVFDRVIRSQDYRLLPTFLARFKKAAP